MRKAPLLVLARVAALAALAASAALYVHYVNPVDGAFCGADSGCETVRRSGFAYAGSRYVNLPLLGLVAYATVLFSSLGVGRFGRAFVPLSVLGGVLGLALVGAQATLVDAFCWLCLVVDGAAVVVAIAAALSARAEPSPEPLAPGAWAALAVVAMLAPPAWTIVRPVPDVPAALRALWAPGKINVVEFVDYQCPHCRALHPVLKKVVAERADRVHFVRMNMPLKGHPNARTAARAAVCAEHQGKGDAMADALFAAEAVDETANLHTARAVGLDLAALRRCIADPATDARIDRDAEILREAGFLGLPTTYVGAQRIVGSGDEAVFREALDRAERGGGPGGVPLPAFLALVAAAGGVVAWRGRRRRARTGSS